MKIKNWCKENKNEITFAGGIACIALGLISAIKAGMKQADIKADHEETLDAIIDPINNELSEKEQKKYKRTLYLKTAGKTALNCAPAFIVTATGVALMGKAYNNVKDELYSVKKDLAATSACLAATEQLFSKYRANVRKAYGDEVDQRMLNGTETVTYTEVDEKGKEKKKSLDVSDGQCSVTRWYMIEGEHPYYDADQEYMTDTAQRWQDRLNDELIGSKSKILPLYRALEVCGFEPSEEEMLPVLAKRWTYEPGNPKYNNKVEIKIKRTHVRSTNSLGEEYYKNAYIFEFNPDEGGLD